ncbi:hypothetical protein [Paramicrobacterium agarici]|uniref:hypothetical protein n=1 Tax=Paramicrobacterium agarici TaxID=630514 RepID=UPI00116F0DE0|nr:hypothetical protein [Microbacterium agarici]TQO22507.1 hypothetical protein FB385_1338 [Microbacterium agarici]
MLLPIKDHHGLETVLNVLLIRFGIIAAVVVAIVVGLFAIALWLRRRGRLGDASRRVAPLARKAAEYRSRRSHGRSDIVSSGLSSLASALERHDDKHNEHDR